MILRGQGCGQTPDRRLALPIRGRLARSPAISQTCPAGPQGQHHRQPIGYHHKLAGHESPTNQEGVKVVLRGIRRTIGTARAGEGPQRNMIGRRDRALLAVESSPALSCLHSISTPVPPEARRMLTASRRFSAVGERTDRTSAPTTAFRSRSICSPSFEAVLSRWTIPPATKAPTIAATTAQARLLPEAITIPAAPSATTTAVPLTYSVRACRASAPGSRPCRRGWPRRRSAPGRCFGR